MRRGTVPHDWAFFCKKQYQHGQGKRSAVWPAVHEYEKRELCHREIPFQFVCADRYVAVCDTWGCPYAAFPFSGSAAAVL